MFIIDVRVQRIKNRVALKALISPQKKDSNRTITSATVLLNGRVVNQLKIGASMSSSPYISIRFKGFMNDRFEVICIDNVGQSYSKKGKVII